MTAAYLDAVLNAQGGDPVDIALLESPDVPRIGVGEATIPSITHILSVIGIDEVEFLKRVEGTYKQAIKYVNWLDGKGEGYYHAFGRYRSSPIDTTTMDWLRSDRSVPFSETISAQPVICEACLAPKTLDQNDIGPRFTYAFHMNALKFADYLCEIATRRGVTHHIDHMVDVEMTEAGDIAAVKTRGGLRLDADLFVDATGFAGLLIEKQLAAGWVDCSQWLLCDRALTIQVPYEHSYPGYVRPNTLATAVSAGWIWEILLQTRRPWVYVHSSQYIEPEEAERELRAFVGAPAEGFEPRLVPFKVGHRDRSWVRNCVAIGLSAGFIEPLESTGLYLSDLAAVMLTDHFPRQSDYTSMAYRFNRLMLNRFYEIVDFINLHYCLTRRSDSEFWREVQRPERINDRLKAKLDFWRVKPPSLADFEDQFFPGQPLRPYPHGDGMMDDRAPVDPGGIFTLSSYEAILYGMDFLAPECDRWFGGSRPRTQVQPNIARRVQMAGRGLPPHDAWLRHVTGMPDFPVL